MPRTKSAAKQMRASLRRRARNKRVLTFLHHQERKVRGLISAAKKDEAAKEFSRLMSALDKAAKRKIIHANQARRKKSRIAASLKKAFAA
jgi:small subunit ribosomal protein S20